MIPARTKVASATGPRWIHLCVVLVPAAFAGPAGGQLQEALTAQVQADQAAAQSQNTVNELRERTQDASARASQSNAEAESLERFNRQLEEQVRAQETEVASIEKQLVDIETTNREVQPLMQQMVDTLARFIELDYGQTLDAYEGPLGTGPDARTVEFAQLGRVSLMYRTLDGSETGYWDANQKAWVVDNSYAEAIEKAIRVANGDDTADLLTVPVPAPQEVRS